MKAEVEAGEIPVTSRSLLAQELVAQFHVGEYDDALADFEARFRQGALPDEIPEFTFAGETAKF